MSHFDQRASPPDQIGSSMRENLCLNCCVDPVGSKISAPQFEKCIAKLIVDAKQPKGGTRKPHFASPRDFLHKFKTHATNFCDQVFTAYHPNWRLRVLVERRAIRQLSRLSSRILIFEFRMTSCRIRSAKEGHFLCGDHNGEMAFKEAACGA